MPTYSLDKFPQFLNMFKTTNIWKAMETTVEDSCWHREANVAVHTEMSMNEANKWFLRSRSLDGGQRHKVLTLLAILFHDTGKPEKETIKESEERGVYRSYASHEQRSARIFEGFVVDHWDEWFNGWIDADDVYTITWIIEHHLPYGMKQPTKVQAFAKSLLGLPRPGDIRIFFNVLLGDSHGRISDDHEKKLVDVAQWIMDTKESIKLLKESGYNPHTRTRGEKQGHLVLLVGPPGVGKSTVRETYGGEYWTFSLDDERINFAASKFKETFPFNESAIEKYNFAFRTCVENEKDFNAYVEELLRRIFFHNTHVIIDNTNTSVKSRRKYLEIAKQYKLWTTAVYFFSSVDMLMQRNESRTDKKLPEAALTNMFYAVSLPSLGGEVDELIKK